MDMLIYAGLTALSLYFAVKFVEWLDEPEGSKDKIPFERMFPSMARSPLWLVKYRLGRKNLGEIGEIRSGMVEFAREFRKARDEWAFDDDDLAHIEFDGKGIQVWNYLNKRIEVLKHLEKIDGLPKRDLGQIGCNSHNSLKSIGFVNKSSASATTDDLKKEMGRE